MTSQEPVFIALGANLPYAGRAPLQSLEAALARLRAFGVPPVRISSWYRSRPVPISDQPDFINGVAQVRTGLAPPRLLRLLHQVEAELGRIRRIRFEARPIDLDLLAYGGRIVTEQAGGGLVLPHPRLAERGFVLVPWAEIEPGWRHPVSGRSVGEMLDYLPPHEKTGVTPIA